MPVLIGNRRMTAIRNKKKATQADITRAIKGVLAAGVSSERIAGVSVSEAGVVILFGERDASNGRALNEWDEVLK